LQYFELNFVKKKSVIMASRGAISQAMKQVRPILSVDKEEARKRVLNLYKAWYRQIPYVGKNNFFLDLHNVFG
jgi:hypothetical protein